MNKGLLFIFLIFCSNTFAQRVGIGSTQFTPSSTLDVKGNMTIGNNYSGSSAASSNGLIVEGNVGIGTTAAGFLLDVAGRARLRTGGGTAGVWFMNNANSSNRAFIGMNSDDIFGIFGAGGGGWYLNVNVTNGRVGIGTTDPQNILHVVGSGTSTIRIVDGNQGANKVLTSDASGNATWQTASTGTSCFSNVVAFTSSTTWVVPAGITKAQIEVWGYGFDGSGGFENSGGFGGQGGRYCRSISTVTAGATLYISVGTRVNGLNSCVATGNYYTSGGSCLVSSSGIGTIVIAGSTSRPNGAGVAFAIGGNGGSAYNGGQGGSGGVGPGGDGGPGQFPGGGGGGGGGNFASSGTNGGEGANGYVVITY